MKKFKKNIAGLYEYLEYWHPPKYMPSKESIETINYVSTYDGVKLPYALTSCAEEEEPDNADIYLANEKQEIGFRRRYTSGLMMQCFVRMFPQSTLILSSFINRILIGETLTNEDYKVLTNSICKSKNFEPHYLSIVFEFIGLNLANIMLHYSIACLASYKSKRPIFQLSFIQIMPIVASQEVLTGQVINGLFCDVVLCGSHKVKNMDGVDALEHLTIKAACAWEIFGKILTLTEVSCFKPSLARHAAAQKKTRKAA